MSASNTAIIDEFRANKGMVGGAFDGKPVLLLHHIGAKTGTRRVNPLMYRQEGDTFYVFATKAGADTHPDWYHNLKANPAAAIEVGTERFAVVASEIEGGERDRIYQSHAATFPQFADYQTGTIRTIPVFALVPG